MARTETLSAPFGYDEIVPLDKSHRVLMPSGTTPSFCRSINALAVSVGEFIAAARDYPIVFATGDGGKSFAPVILLGLEAGVNLFLDESGEWDRAAYFPAYVRRFPFCLFPTFTGALSTTSTFFKAVRLPTSRPSTKWRKRSWKSAPPFLRRFHVSLKKSTRASLNKVPKLRARNV